MKILDGKMTSRNIAEQLKSEVSKIKEETSLVPTLAIILVGNFAASHIYVKNKIKTASAVGIKTILIELKDDVSEQMLLQEVEKLNNDPTVNGIIVQLPLPKHINEQTIIDNINKEKDVDGFGVTNKGLLFSGLPCLHSATPKGIITLLKKYDIKLMGAHVVVVGRSNIVGKPMSIMCLNESATVTIAHSKTKDLKAITKLADILIVAVGKANLITADMVKEGVVVVDVGTNYLEGKLVGDVAFDEVSHKCSYISPVPGGVGPMTIISLLENTVQAFYHQKPKELIK